MAPEPAQSEGIGLGMLLTIAALATAAAVLAVLLVTKHHSRHAAAASTVFVTRAMRTALAQTHGTPTTTAAQSTTDPTTTEAATTTETTTTRPTTATVPAVSGDLQAALQAVRNAGLTAVVHYVPSSEARGQVVAQSPSGGTSAPTTAQVTINVSAGPGAESVSVPSTIGMSIPQAVATVQSAGLHLVLLRRSVTDQSQAGEVVDQSPAPGQQAPKNSRVVVYMGAFKG